MAITYVGAGAGASAATGTTAPPLPAGLATNDILWLVIEHANQTTTIATTGGGTWTQVTGSPQGTGTVGGLSSAGIQVYWSRYDGSQTAPTITDSGDHTAARIYAFRGCKVTGSPINASVGSVGATSNTALSATGLTTTAANCWVLVAATLMDDGMDFGATWTNANLTAITVRNASFAHTAGGDGRLILVTGERVTAGVVAATTNTLTAASVKAHVVAALEPEPVAPSTTITPVTLKLVAVPVTSTPGQVTTSITPAVLRLQAVAVGGAPGPGSLILTPATLRFTAVPITPTAQPVTTAITPAVLRLATGNVIVPLRESFNTIDGVPLGPDRTWTRKIFLEANQWQIASNRARFQIAAAAGDIIAQDLQVPTPNITGIDNQQAILNITAASHTGGPDFALSANVVLRYALFNGDVDFRGYVFGIGVTDAFDPGSFATAWLYLGRFDTASELTTLGFSTQTAGFVTFPGTLTVRADGNQISAKFEHLGSGPALVAAVTDNTYTDGGLALLGKLDLNAGDTGIVEIDDLYAYTAPTEPATVTLRPAVLRLSAAPALFLSGIDAGDTSTPPTDIYDAGDTASPPTDINDPEAGFVTITPAVLRLEPEQVVPLGQTPGQTPITPITLRLTAVPITPIPIQVITTITPVVIRLAPVPVTATLGQVTTTIIPAILRLLAVELIPIPPGFNEPEILTLAAFDTSQTLAAVGASLTLVAMED